VKGARWLAGAPVAPLVVLFGLNLIDELDAAAFSVLLPEIRRTFGLSVAAVATLAAAVVPVAVGIELAVAYAADRWRRRELTALGALVTGACSAATGLAGTIGGLGAARIAASIGRSATATHPSLLADVYPSEVRSRVFALHGLANPAGALLGAGVAGLLAAPFGWRAPFVVFAVPAAALTLAALRLPEPVRGELDRREAGADETLATLVERSPGLSETFRALSRLSSARWIYAALACSTAGSIGTGTFIGLFYDEALGVDAAGRGALGALMQVPVVAALLAGAAFSRSTAARPGRSLVVVGILAAGSGAALLAVAAAPGVAVAATAQAMSVLLGTLSLPVLLAAASLVVPARMRTMGFATGSVWALTGLAVVPFVGVAGDRFGTRVAMAAFVPFLVAAGGCLAMAGRFVERDAASTATSARAAAEDRARRLAGDPHVLVLRDVSVRAGGTAVVTGVDLAIRDGELVALLGANGAGKTTLLEAIAGLSPVTGGTVLLDGIDVTDADPRTRVRLGLVLAPSGDQVLGDLSVAEHLDVAATADRNGLDLGVASFSELTGRPDQPVTALSGGERQLLNLATAVALRPRVLLVDEVSMGLSSGAVRRVVDVLRELHRRDVTVVFVDQGPALAAALEARVVFLDDGAVAFDGSAGDLVRHHDLVRRRRLPAVAAVPRRTRRGCDGSPCAVLQASGIVARFGGVLALAGVDVEVRSGEILAIVGPNGAGKTTLLDVLSGLTAPSAGRIVLGDVDITQLPARRRADLGLARSFQHASLWPSLRVRDAVAVALDVEIRHVLVSESALGLPPARLGERYLDERIDPVLELVGLGDRGDRGDHRIGTLSAGTRRLVELAVAMARRPAVLLLDEPAAGVAHAERPALASLIRRLPHVLGGQASIVLVEHDHQLVSQVADRAVALAAGSILDEGRVRRVLRSTRPAASSPGRRTVT
jgi:ABC-type branched-subunit amino acid transport system ATPase component/MFS family permease